MAVQPLDFTPVAWMLIAPDTVEGAGPGAAAAAGADALDSGRMVAPIHSPKMKAPPLRLGVMAGSANLRRWRRKQSDVHRQR